MRLLIAGIFGIIGFTCLVYGVHHVSDHTTIKFWIAMSIGIPSLIFGKITLDIKY